MLPIVTPHFPLYEAHKPVFKELFVKQHEVIVLKPLTGGLSGSSVYLAQAQGGLPIVVKIDRPEAITQELKSYQDHVEEKLAGIANIARITELTENMPWAGLTYEFIGAGNFAIESLESFLSEPTTPILDIDYVLEKRLFGNLKPWWRNSQKRAEIRQLGREYDSVLPINLIIEYKMPAASAKTELITPHGGLYATVRQGDVVLLKGFVVEETKPDSKGLILNASPGSSDKFRVRVNGVPNWQTFPVGNQITSLTGKIVTTRLAFLKQKAASFLDDSLNLSGKRLQPLPELSFPNPLTHFEARLKKGCTLFPSSIHGDLNLQNVLVETEGRNAHMIDFAKACEGHNIRDLLHLEMSIVRKLVAPAIVDQDYAQSMADFYGRLDAAWYFPGEVQSPAKLERPFEIIQIIRKTAFSLLYDDSSWREYYDGLFFYLLGILRHNEKPHELTVVFWGAAAILKLLKEPLTEEEMRHRYLPPPVDFYTPYEDGLARLNERIANNGVETAEFSNCEKRLRALIARSRIQNDTNYLRLERSAVLRELNQLARTHLGTTFTRLILG